MSKLEPPLGVERPEGWSPPLKFEEQLKRLLPPMARIRYLYARNLRNGEAELGLVPFLADKRRVSIDVGANKGVFSYAMLNCSKEVYAFEPNPKLFRMLSSWAKGRVHLHSEALSNQTGRAKLLLPISVNGYSNQGASLSETKVTGTHDTVTINTVRLDDLGIKNVGFIKIDVEGFEHEVLEGAEETIQRDKPNLLVEMEELHNKKPIQDSIDSICSRGYDCFVLSRGTLTPIARIDLPARHGRNTPREDYLYNFVFLPK